MSLKDDRFFRLCPICGDKLIGTDDGLEVFESLKQQLTFNVKKPDCALCGEPCNVTKAQAIIKAGEPKLQKEADHE